MTHSDTVQQALKYVELNLYKELTVDEISSEVGYSKFYLLGHFKKKLEFLYMNILEKEDLLMQLLF